MRILVSWLHEFVTFDASIRELADALTMRGFEVVSIESPPSNVVNSGADAVLDLEITTNRPDCLSVLGIAREISTIYNTALTRPPLADDDAKETDSNRTVSVTIEDAELCSRYAASVEEVTIGPSPTWLAARLEATGVRPINNVVDVTNYVMLELGQPMHAFDLDRLSGASLRIRRAIQGETVRTLDGQERNLTPEMLVIADADQPQAVAGVMGGANSEVGAGTKAIAFESACFKPISVRRTSKQLGLSTDASYRFERGVDIDAPVVAIRRARSLLSKIGVGRSVGQVIDCYPTPAETIKIELRYARIERIMGQVVDPAFVRKTLERLEFGVRELESSSAGPRWQVTVPPHRTDVSLEINLIEEIARHHGYDRLPTTFPTVVSAPAPTGAWLQRNRLLRRVLTGSGCWEAITYGFIEQASATVFVSDPGEIVSIANPLSEKYAVLRPSLLPGLLDSLVRNRRREHRDVRFFEIGNTFRRSNGESSNVAMVMTGAGLTDHWSTSERPIDLFDVKGVVERVCHSHGVISAFEPTECAWLVSGRAAIVRAQSTGDELGFLGQLTPSIATSRGFPSTNNEVYVAELYVAVLDRMTIARDSTRTEPRPKYPSIIRDLAILIDATLPAGVVRGTIQAAAPDTLVNVQEFDRYEGQGVSTGLVSLALRLTFRAGDRTLTDAEVQEAIGTIVSALKQQHQAKLR